MLHTLLHSDEPDEVGFAFQILGGTDPHWGTRAFAELVQHMRLAEYFRVIDCLVRLTPQVNCKRLSSFASEVLQNLAQPDQSWRVRRAARRAISKLST